MRITGKLKPNNAKQALVIAAESRPFNVLAGDVDKPFLSCSFSDLKDIRTHCEIASRTFSNILVFIAEPLNCEAINFITLICGKSASLSIEIPEDFTIRDYRDLFAQLVPEEELRYLCLKGKKVGEHEWANA